MKGVIVLETESTEYERIEHEWFDYRAAQDYTGLSRTFLWGKIGTGELRAFKVGRKVRIDRRDLDEFMMLRSAASRGHVEGSRGRWT